MLLRRHSWNGQLKVDSARYTKRSTGVGAGKPDLLEHREELMNHGPTKGTA